MKHDEDKAQPAPVGQVERGVGRLEPERDDLPSTVFVVLDEMGIPMFCATYPQACNDHISDAIVEHEIHSAGLWVVREYTLDPRTRSQKMAEAGFVPRPSLRALEMRAALELIAAPKRPDGTWNRDREACRELAAEALGRHEDDSERVQPLGLGSGEWLGMSAKSIGERVEKLRQEREALGLRRRELYAHDDAWPKLQELAAKLQRKRERLSKQGKG